LRGSAVASIYKTCLLHRIA